MEKTKHCKRMTQPARYNRKLGSGPSESVGEGMMRQSGILRKGALRFGTAMAALLAACSGGSSSGPGTATSATVPIQHVFVIVLENEDADTSFGPNSPAPYLANTLTSMGAFVPNYYGIGHHSLDNYIALVSGQPPNAKTQQDCTTYSDFKASLFGGGEPGIPKGSGCVYPADVKNLADQLEAANLTWRGYMEDMGNDPTRETATCGHPAVGAKDNTQKATSRDQYATRHDPFVYFHDIIDDQSRCDAHVINLNALPQDLQQVSTTPNFSLITPDLCEDGHDSKCADGGQGGLPRADQFLQLWVPMIMQSPAYQKDGLLIVLFDESEKDNTACCNEPTGPNTKKPGLKGAGGGRIGAVMLSPFIQAGTVSQSSYNHYALLRSVEDMFKLDYLGYAAQEDLQSFGPDIFNKAP